MQDHAWRFVPELICAYMLLDSGSALAKTAACDNCRPATQEELIMTTIPYRTALIVGAGSGISASVARGLATVGLKVGLAARNIDQLAPLAAQIDAERFAVDASDPAAAAHLFEAADARFGPPEVV